MSAIQQILFSYGLSAPAGPSDRYWRIYITANGGNAYTAMQEIELRGSVGGTDLTFPLTPTADSDHFSGRAADETVSNIFGSDSDNGWTSDGSALPHWCSYDLGSSMSVAELAIWGDPTIAARSPKDFLIESSPDNATWTTRSTQTNIIGWTTGQNFKTFAL